MGLPPMSYAATKRLAFRALSARDAKDLLALVAASRPELGRFMTWPREMVGLEQARRFISLGRDGYLAERTIRMGIFERDTGELCGSIELDNIDLRRLQAELGYWIRTDRAGRGYATEAGIAMLYYAYRSLGMHKIRADVAVGNDASARVLGKLGFVLEGRLREDRIVGGEYMDHWRFGLLDREFEERFGKHLGPVVQPTSLVARR